MIEHQWVCTGAGMFVSLFECKICKTETRNPYDDKTCPGHKDGIHA